MYLHPSFKIPRRCCIVYSVYIVEHMCHNVNYILHWKVEHVSHWSILCTSVTSLFEFPAKINQVTVKQLEFWLKIEFAPNCFRFIFYGVLRLRSIFAWFPFLFCLHKSHILVRSQCCKNMNKFSSWFRHFWSLGKDYKDGGWVQL